MDKLKKIINSNKKIYTFLIGLIIIGLVFGSSMPLFLNTSDKEIITNYMAEFVKNIENIDPLFLLKNSILNNLTSSFFIWILGISIIGIPIVIIIFFFKVFIMGFSITAIILNYGIKGILFSAVYIFPTITLEIIIYLIITTYSIIFSSKLIFHIFKKKEFNITTAFKKYLKIYINTLLILIVVSLYDAFVNPQIFKFIFNLLSFT